MISLDPTAETQARMRVDDADALRPHLYSQSRSRSGQIQGNANGKLLPSAEVPVCWPRSSQRNRFAGTRWPSWPACSVFGIGFAVTCGTGAEIRSLLTGNNSI